METVNESKRLVRSLEDRAIAGVAGGLATYLGVDAVWVRLSFVLSTLLWGLGVIAYALLWITLPEQGEEEGAPARPPLALENPKAVVGVILLSLGVLILLWKLLSLLSIMVVLPLLFVGLGLFLLLHRSQ